MEIIIGDYIGTTIGIRSPLPTKHQTNERCGSGRAGHLTVSQSAIKPTT